MIIIKNQKESDTASFEKRLKAIRIKLPLKKWMYLHWATKEANFSCVFCNVDFFALIG